MIIKLNITGTHIHKGLLKLRADLYPSVNDKTYAFHHVYVPVIPEDATEEQLEDKAWVDALPHIWQLNPALCHFFAVPEDFRIEDVEDYLRNLFDSDTWTTLDNHLLVPDSVHYISPYMKSKRPFTELKVETQDLVDLIVSTNAKLSGQNDIEIVGDGNTGSIIPESIDIGNEAIDRELSKAISYYTMIALENPANASGTLDTVQVYASANITALETATFYGSNPYSTRDYENCGDATAGSTVTFSGLDIDVETGDYLGGKSTGGQIETDSGGNCAYKSGDYIPCTDETFSTTWWLISLYAKGTEGGGTTEKVSSDSGAGQDTVVTGSPESEVIGADTGSGIESSSLETGDVVNKFSSDTSVGVDIGETEVYRVVSDSGSGVEETIVSPVFFGDDTGMGEDLCVLFKIVFDNDAGDGNDNLKALVGAAGVNPDTRLPGSSARVQIPSKKTGIPSKGVNI